MKLLWVMNSFFELNVLTKYFFEHMMFFESLTFAGVLSCQLASAKSGLSAFSGCPCTLVFLELPHNGRIDDCLEGADP